MKIAVITSAPEFIQSYLDNTILKQAINNDSVLFYIIDIQGNTWYNFGGIFVVFIMSYFILSFILTIKFYLGNKPLSS